MVQPTPQILLSSHPAQTPITSDPITQCLNYSWVLKIIKTGVNGNPKITIEQSVDGDNWAPYIDNEICTDIILNGVVTINDDVFLITDTFFNALYFRVVYDPNGVTTGTVDISLTEKIKT